MSVETTLNRKSYSGDGIAVAFPTTFQFLAAGDLRVIERVTLTGVETVKLLTTHYTVTGGNGSIGTVTMLAAPAVGVVLTVYNDPSLTQGLDLVEGDASPAETKERAWDRLTFIAQRLANRIDRSITLSEGFSAAFNLTLPSVLVADTVVAINLTADGFVTGPTTAAIAAAAANAAAAAASAAAALASQIAALAANPVPVAVRKTFADSPYTILPTDARLEFDCTGGNVIATLPDRAAYANRTLSIDRVDLSANTLTLNRAGADVIGDQTLTDLSYVMSEMQSQDFFAGTTFWKVRG